MSFSQKLFLRGALWTIGAYTLSVGVRFLTNVGLTRLVAPEIFGIGLIVATLRNGIDLVFDAGIGQNIVQNPNGDTRAFRDTAWTVQFIRCMFLYGVLMLAAGPLTDFYELPRGAIQITALTFLFGAVSSVSLYVLQRRLQFARANLFELAMDVVGAVAILTLTWFSPTIWSFLIAGVVSTVIRVAATYLLPDARVWFCWNRDHVRQILSFGKWIYLSSLLSFACASFDKLFLGQAVPFAVLGVYGLARNMAELPAALFGRLGYSVLFPVVSAHQEGERPQLRARLAAVRIKLLLLGALGLGFGAAFADVFIGLIYDQRYHDAGWMLAPLLVGAWFAILCTFNDYSLLGTGRALYGAMGNGAKLAVLAVGTPLAIGAFGLLGVIGVLGASELARYIPILGGQRREGLSFLAQDLALTVLMLAALAGFTALRWQAGYGTVFAGMHG